MNPLVGGTVATSWCYEVQLYVHEWEQKRIMNLCHVTVTQVKCQNLKTGNSHHLFNSWRNAGACVSDAKELRRQESSKNCLPAGSGEGLGRICPLSFSRIPTLTHQGKLVYVENEVSV